MAATAAVVLLATGLAACAPDEQSDDSDAQPPRRTPSPTATQASETSPTAEPTKGVGPRKGALRSADILVFSKDTLTDDVIERIREVKGVRSVEPLSMAQVSIENRAINIAAVDPATYRNYTRIGSANLQEQWDRVAAGQLALVKKLKKRVPEGRHPPARRRPPTHRAWPSAPTPRRSRDRRGGQRRPSASSWACSRATR